MAKCYEAGSKFIRVEKGVRNWGRRQKKVRQIYLRTGKEQGEKKKTQTKEAKK